MSYEPLPDLDNGPERPRYGDARRSWHPRFVEYMYSIVSHPAYANMPATTDETGKIDWTIPTGRKPNSKNWEGNRLRKDWWREKAGELGIATEGHWISRTAKRIHPYKRKPCQTCGRVMRIEYAYPTVRTIERLNGHLADDAALSYSDLLELPEVFAHFGAELGEKDALEALTEVFPELKEAGAATLDELKEAAEVRLIQAENRKLSPGAMSNPPDRLDGFHTYNLCCRSKEDTGRATENLKTYGVDRRAFEHWSQGDWAAANLLMSKPEVGRCPRCGNETQLTADHIGPISLGFRHTPHFDAVCLPCNSAKNNRMSLADVQRLLALEEAGEEVISWQALHLWNELKGIVGSDDDALRLSKLLNVNQHHYLRLLVRAREAGIADALIQFLSPEYSEERITFVGLDPLTLEYSGIERRPRQESYALGIAARLYRIAFESLDDYAMKENRNVQTIPPDRLTHVDKVVEEAIQRAVEEPSEWREPLNRAIDPLLAPAARSSSLLALLEDGYGPTDQFDDIARAFAKYMDEVGAVLVERFDDDRAIKEWDDQLGGEDLVTEAP